MRDVCLLLEGILKSLIRASSPEDNDSRPIIYISCDLYLHISRVLSWYWIRKDILKSFLLKSDSLRWDFPLIINFYHCMISLSFLLLA